MTVVRVPPVLRSEAGGSREVEASGETAYSGRQIFSALQRRRLRSFDEMTDLPKAFREKLSEAATASTLAVESRYVAEDGTRRYLMKTRDGLPVETVFIPEERRDTICFSSQSGCPLQCDFCLTAKLGLLRSLTAGEMVEQIVVALNDAYGVGEKTPRGTNLVAMECMASGVPTIVSANTGHLDLASLGGCYTLTQQGRVPTPTRAMRSEMSWLCIRMQP